MARTHLAGGAPVAAATVPARLAAAARSLTAVAWTVRAGVPGAERRLGGATWTWAASPFPLWDAAVHEYGGDGPAAGTHPTGGGGGGGDAAATAAAATAAGLAPPPPVRRRADQLVVTTTQLVTPRRGGGIGGRPTPRGAAFRVDRHRRR